MKYEFVFTSSKLLVFMYKYARDDLKRTVDCKYIQNYVKYTSTAIYVPQLRYGN